MKDEMKEKASSYSEKVIKAGERIANIILKVCNGGNLIFCKENALNL